MKLQILSDCHHEFYRDLDLGWIHEVIHPDANVLVLAGDICSYPKLETVLKEYIKLDLPIVFVPGNHEYYRGTNEDVDGLLYQLDRENDNFHYLNNKAVEIDGQRFVGSTLWYPNHPTALLNCKDWNDFRVIEGNPESWIWQAANMSNYYLTENVRDSDVVVTHMLPSWQSVADEYKGVASNCFFVHSCEDLIVEKQPKLWIHGHTHSSHDYNIIDTRVVANPRGYPNRKKGHGMAGGFNEYENIFFLNRFVVEV